MNRDPVAAAADAAVGVDTVSVGVGSAMS